MKKMKKKDDNRFYVVWFFRFRRRLALVFSGRVSISVLRDRKQKTKVNDARPRMDARSTPRGERLFQRVSKKKKKKGSIMTFYFWSHAISVRYANERYEINRVEISKEEAVHPSPPSLSLSDPSLRILVEIKNTDEKKISRLPSTPRPSPTRAPLGPPMVLPPLCRRNDWRPTDSRRTDRRSLTQQRARPSTQSRRGAPRTGQGNFDLVRIFRFLQGKKYVYLEKKKKRNVFVAHEMSDRL